MKSHTLAAFVLIALGLAASPALAQAQSGGVTGLGPGGSGAGQSPKGPGKASIQGRRYRHGHIMRARPIR